MDIEGIELPEDVLVDILSRIPAKSLLRFKSVSKYWYSLFQNPNFISLHHTRAQPNDCLFIKRHLNNNEFETSMSLLANQTSFQDLDLSFTGLNVNDLCLQGSSNGVMCLSNDSQIVICNPATREFRLLPQPPYHTRRTSMLRFAFDPETNDYYKVVRVATLFESDLKPFDSYADPYDEIGLMPVDHKIHVYDVGMDSWREIAAVVPKYFFEDNNPCRCTSLGGDFYWLGFDFDSNVHMIGVMRTFQESFERMPLPDIFCPEFVMTRTGNLCVLKDSLALVFSEYVYELKETRFDIWVMEEYGVESSWTKKYSIGPLVGCPFSLGFRPNDEVLLTKSCNSSQMVSYNLSTQDTKEYNQLCDRPGSHLRQVFPYVESLISINRLVV